jgi:hypothetical protein
MLFMSLDVLSVLNSTVFGIINLKASDDSSWTEGLGHAKPVGEGVDPKNTQENHLNNHPGREMLERHRVVCATSTFFGGANAPFNVRDVFVLSTYVEFRVQIGGDGATKTFKLGVSKHEGNAEASFGVDVMDALYRFGETGLFSIVKDFSGDEPDVARDRHRKWNPVHEHYVGT